MDEKLLQAMNDRLEESKLPCNQAFAIAKMLEREPVEVGVAANESGIRISRCQLGLFGYGPKKLGKHKIVEAMDNVPERLAARLREAADEGQITCTSIWRVADSLGYKRMEASSAVETIGLKVSRCQLACFPRPWRG